MKKQDEEEKWKKILNIPFLRGDLVASRRTTPIRLKGTPLSRLVKRNEIFIVLGIEGNRVRISDGETLLAEEKDLRTVKRKEREVELSCDTELLNLDTEEYQLFSKGTKFKIKAEKEGLYFLSKGDSYYITQIGFLRVKENEKDKGTRK